MEMTITNEDLALIRKFEDIKKRGFYCSGQEVTELHNRVLGTRLTPTNCSACISQRILALVEAANKFERMLAKQQENNAATEPSKEDLMKEKMAKVRAARKKKD